MELRTIGQVSGDYGISARMLRYYEKTGLIRSLRKEDYAYRMYDETALRRLRQIVILRRLRVSVKQIAVILSEPAAEKAMEILAQNISEIDDEINALSVIRNVLKSLAAELREQAGICPELGILTDSSVLAAVGSLPLPKNQLKEKTDMEDLKKAEEKYGRLTDKDVRIVYLPPSAVAASHSVGDEPENAAAQMTDKFVMEHNLPEICPGLRHYGFNHPNPADETGDHGYEIWVTIPGDMEVDAPLMKKYFQGGLYAARMIPFGAFEEWDRLYEWVRESEKYDFNLTEDGGECMYGLLEEHLNYRNRVKNSRTGDLNDFQLDLLLPVKEKG